MPAAFEQVLNKPLSGEDVRRIIMVKIGDMLTRESRLAGHMAFPAFSAKVTIAIQLENAVHPNIDRELDIKDAAEGEKPFGTVPERPSEFAVMTEEIEKMTPNEARIDAGLGVPVLTRDEKGREVEKEIKYERPAKKRKAGNS